MGIPASNTEAALLPSNSEVEFESEPGHCGRPRKMSLVAAQNAAIHKSRRQA